MFTSKQCASIKLLSISSAYSNRYCFRSYIIPFAILVNRSVIFGRYCIIRLLQLNALPVCLALNRLNKFNNIFYQFSKEQPLGFRFDLSLATRVLSQMLEPSKDLGESVEWVGVGVPLCPPSNIDPSRKPP